MITISFDCQPSNARDQCAQIAIDYPFQESLNYWQTFYWWMPICQLCGLLNRLLGMLVARFVVQIARIVRFYQGILAILYLNSTNPYFPSVIFYEISYYFGSASYAFIRFFWPYPPATFTILFCFSVFGVRYWCSLSWSWFSYRFLLSSRLLILQSFVSSGDILTAS